MSQRPLFIPVNREWFLAFEHGLKTVEEREYGPRWNEQTCSPGRTIILSLGYSGRRLRAVIRTIQRVGRRLDIYLQDIAPDRSYRAADRMPVEDARAWLRRWQQDGTISLVGVEGMRDMIRVRKLYPVMRQGQFRNVATKTLWRALRRERGWE